MNTDTEQNNKISELERRLDVATTGFIKDIESIKDIMKMGFGHVTEAIKDFEKKTDENCKMLREDSDRYRVDVEERIKTIEDRLETKTTEFEKFMSKINVRLATWSGGLAVVLYILDKLLGLTDKIFK